MTTLGLETEVVDQEALDRTAQRFREAGVLLPTFRELAEPARIPAAIRERLGAIDSQGRDPLNLFRVHWHNGAPGEGFVAVPDHLVLPSELTGVPARIVVLFADRFPMISAHKVLATYGCLVPRLVCGQFDPTRHRAVWPSTGNYCRGGIAISRILRCRGVAVLPEGMSRERFEWLERWVEAPEDIVRTPGTESNVKEIYDRCAELEREPDVVIFNQFAELGNYLAHFFATGRAVETVFAGLRDREPDLALRAFVSATGSAGTLAAGDYLAERLGSRTVAVEALECPTLLYNGFGEHNIQGIGDKHVPWIHNVMATDFVAGVSDRATDHLLVLFASPEGRSYLAERRGVPAAVLDQLCRLGLSSICNVLAAIKVARYLDLGERDVLATVATDGASLYGSEIDKVRARDFPDGFDRIAAGETFGRFVLGAATDHLQELSLRDRERIFNLGYYTWVEQQGATVADFEARRRPQHWRALRALPAAWDARIEELNARTGVRAALGLAAE